MAEEDDKLLTALTTEQFVLQSERGTATAEATSRATVYLSALSAALIALGFTTGKSFFGYFVGAVLPVLAVLGLLTYLRLVQLAADDMEYWAAIQRIRQYYGELHPRGLEFFPKVAAARPQPRSGGGLRFLSTHGWLTAASIIGVVNSMLVGAGLGLAAAALGLAPGAATVIAVGIAAGLSVWHVGAQRRPLDDAGEPDR